MLNNLKIALLMTLLLMCSTANASTWPTTNVCEVEARVVELHKRWIADADPELGMYIQLFIEIENVGDVVRKYGDPRTCQEAFDVGKTIRIGEYEKSLLGNAQALDVDQRIRAAVVSYIKGGQIRPHYVFQAQKENAPLVNVLSP